LVLSSSPDIDLTPCGSLETLQTHSIVAKGELAAAHLYDALPNLKTLNIHRSRALYRQIARLPGLQILHLDFSPWNTPMVLEVVAQIPGVAILQLQHISTQLEARQILALLPLTVERLSLQFVRDGDTAMMHLLADSSFLPVLRHLNIVVSGRPRHKVMADLETLLDRRAIRLTQTTASFTSWVGEGLPAGMK
jgi:hypothetical protein